MRAWITVIFLAVVASTGAQANSITIGQFQYLGTNPQGVSGFEVILNTTGVTASALMLKDLRLTENGTAENAGAITTPTAILFLGGPGFRLPACPCESLQIQLFFPTTEKVFTLQLAGGGFFTTRSTPRFFLRPLPGQRFLLPGQSASVVLTSVPEPGTLALFSGGLAAVVWSCSIGGAGTCAGWDRGLWKSGAVKYESYDVHDLKIRVDGNTAVVSSLISSKRTINGKPVSGDVRSTRVWIKQKGDWKLVTFQATGVASASQ